MSSKKIIRKTRMKYEISKVLKVHFKKVYIFSQGIPLWRKKKKSLEKLQIPVDNFWYYGIEQYNTALWVMLWHGAVCYRAVCYSAVFYSAVWYSAVWSGCISWKEAIGSISQVVAESSNFAGKEKSWKSKRKAIVKHNSCTSTQGKVGCMHDKNIEIWWRKKV